MEKMNIMVVVFLLLSIFLVNSQAKLVPALYVFGDSVVDAGNNNLNNASHAKANFLPYGIDFPKGATGRFTNGRTIADLIARSLGLPHPPAIMNFNTKKAHTSGFNYASGSSGILNESGLKISGGNINMNKQVRLFKRTVRKYLPLHFKNEHKLKRHLAKSIYLVATGSNDYALNFLLQGLYNTSKIYTPLTFPDYLVNVLGNQLQDLYKFGARKFIVFEIGPLGCLPSTIAAMPPIPTRCVEPLNAIIDIFNAKLQFKLDVLTKTLKGSTFVTAKTNKLFYDVINNPTAYGLTDSKNACCPNMCKPNEVPCKDRDTHVFWDGAHPTEAASKISATKCFENSNLCYPMSISKLARMKVKKH